MNDEANFQAFEQAINKVVSFFSKIPKEETIRLISHLDADGISSAALMIKALNRLGYFYVLTILPQLKESDIKSFADEDYKYYVFTDLGSGQLLSIRELMQDKVVFVLDHHQPQINEVMINNNIFHINPHLFGFNGSTELSGSGTTFFFIKSLDKRNEELADIALIGVVGDVMDPRVGLNNKILDIAIKHNKIKVITGLRVFGAQTKPLYKTLVQSSDFYIPGVTGSESGAIQFLKQIGVEPKVNGKWRRIIDLSDEELKRLVAGIVMLRVNEESPEDILGDVYLLTREKEGSPLKDLKEFATVLNACGRLGKASYGIGACLGDERLKRLAINVLDDYKKEIINGMRWVESHHNSEFVIEEPGFLIVNAQNNILPTVIGTVASMLSRSASVADNTFVLTMARIDAKHTKISLRFKGKRDSLNLKEVLESIIKKFDGEAGGHHHAAGAYISVEQEQAFIEEAKRVLGSIAVEEKI